jgi:xylitol oxidase
VENRRNWAGNYSYSASRFYIPESIEQIQDWVAQNDKIKVLGTRHSFNSIADTTGSMLSLQKLNRVIALDKINSRVTVEAGIRYGELSQYLHSNGYALPNLASLPHISVAGACATATHGSGDQNGNLSTTVHSIELVQADGNKASFSRDDQDNRFFGSVVGLGGLGVVTSLTLNVVPTFEMRQMVFENLPLNQALGNIEEIFSSAYSVSLFTDWKQLRFTQVWLKSKTTDQDALSDSDNFLGAVQATGHRHPLLIPASEHCTMQMGIPGPWHERLPHFRMDFTPSFGEELQSEYFVPRHKACEALLALNQIGDHFSSLLHISEIRTIARDSLWMSPCYEQDCVAIHFTWKQDVPRVQQVLPLIEKQLEPFQARPHWGKLFTIEPERLHACYVKLPEFQQLLAECDPQHKFRNRFLSTYIFGS